MKKALSVAAREKQLTSEVQPFYQSCKTLFKAYAFRLNCLFQRHALLEQVSRDGKYDFNKARQMYFSEKEHTGISEEDESSFDFGDSKQTFFDMLSEILNREKTILKLVQTQDGEVISKLDSALSDFEKYQDLFHRRVFLYEKVELDMGLAKEFLSQAISLMESIKTDVAVIEKRVSFEKALIQNPTSENFDRFVHAWNTELYANLVALDHFRLLVELNKKVGYDRTLSELGWKMIFGGKGTLMAAGIVSVIAKSGIALAVGGVVAALLVFSGLACAIGGKVRSQFVFLSHDQELLQALELHKESLQELSQK